MVNSPVWLNAIGFLSQVGCEQLQSVLILEMVTFPFPMFLYLKTTSTGSALSSSGPMLINVRSKNNAPLSIIVFCMDLLLVFFCAKSVVLFKTKHVAKAKI